MIFLAFLLGLVPPTLAGWTLLRVLEGRSPVLYSVERWICGFALGVTVSMFVLFSLNAWAGVPLTWWTYLATEGVLIAIFGALSFRYREPSQQLPSYGSSPRFAWVIVGALLLWTAAKVIAGTFLILTTPSYYDDTLDNWNYRAKIFAHEHAIVLALPPETSTSAISSYPPPVPMIKAGLTLLHGGEWNEGIANIPHVLWLLACGGILWFLIRRHANALWATLGMTIYWSLPLVLMHGTNAYSDVFLSMHYLCVVHFLLIALSRGSADPQRESGLPDGRPEGLPPAVLQSTSSDSVWKLIALAIALLPFTKNEGFALYLPAALLTTGIVMLIAARKAALTRAQAMLSLLWIGGMLGIVTLSWIDFKIANDLTFGNAKGLSGLLEGWQPNVVQAITINTFLEGNWLLLFPFLLMLLLWNGRQIRHLTIFLVLLVSILLPYGAQLLLFLFTSLSVEALMQTGYARGLIHLMPVIVALTILLLRKTLTVERREEIPSYAV